MATGAEKRKGLMEKQTYTVTFYHPQTTIIEVNKGRDLLSAAVESGIHIYSSCGGDGVCGRCKVIIKRGDLKTEPSGRISSLSDKKDMSWLAKLPYIAMRR